MQRKQYLYGERAVPRRTMTRHTPKTLPPLLTMVENFNLSQLLPRMKALHDRKNVTFQYKSKSLNGEQIVLKGHLPPIQAENVLTQSDIEHICQHLHLDAGNLMQWQWSFFTRAFIAKDVFHSHMYKTKKLNNYTVLYKQDTEGSGLGEIHFYFTLQLPTGEVYQKAMVTHLETLSQQAITGIELVDEYLRNRMIQYLHPFEAKGYRKAVRALRTIGKECIVKRIKALDSGEEVPNDILTHILKVASANESADIETLVDDFVTFYVAGQETTANTLSFAVILVHQHPEVLERLLAEIDEVLGSRTSVTAEDLEKLKYTEQIIEETLRLYGPVGGQSKEAPEGGLTLSGYHIPEGTGIATMTAVACRMPQYFDDPDTFKPARFDPENKRPSPFVYFPFGVGHRACIGRHFAMMEAKLVLSRLLQTFHVALPSDYKICVVEHTTRQPYDNIMCTLQPRMK
ncbi:hypothetical protein EMCRGX_G012887 [Ephydatia muelleri]